MKILVVSLLRLGDIVLGTSAIRSLRQAHPDAKIDLLLNSQFRSVEPLMPFINKFIHFDREEIQHSLGEKNRSFFEGFERLQRLRSELVAEEYDLVVNLTHTALSGWICAIGGAKDVRGLVFNGSGRPGFGSPWFRYLNDFVAAGGANAIHYSDVFAHGAVGSGTTGSKSLWLEETANGRKEAHGFVGGIESYYCVQLFTSDLKKNWGEERFVQTISMLHALHPSATSVLVGSPAEADRLRATQEELGHLGVASIVAPIGLEGAYSLVKRAKFLLTGDTSIKHFAAAADIPIIEISIGSSNFRYTGAYRDNSVIVQSRESCAPCNHSEECHRIRHFCGERLSADLVALVSDKLIAGDWTGLRVVAEEFREEATLYRTRLGVTGLWEAFSVGEHFGPAAVARLLDRISWKMLLDREHRQTISSFGSQGQSLLRFARLAFPGIESKDWSHLLDQSEKDLSQTEQQVGELMRGFQQTLRSYQSESDLGPFTDRLRQYAQQHRNDALLASHSKVFENAITESGADFVRIKKIREALVDVFSRIDIEKRLIKVLRSQIKEVV